MKEYLVQVPTSQYEFCQVKAASAIEAKQLRDEILEAWRTPSVSLETAPGLNTRDWNAALDNFLINNTVDIDVHERMSTNQQRCIKEVQKATLRINNKK